MFIYYRPGRNYTLPPNKLTTIPEDDEDERRAEEEEEEIGNVPQPPRQSPGIPEQMAGEEEEEMEVDTYPPPRMLSPVFPVIPKGHIPPHYRRE